MKLARYKYKNTIYRGRLDGKVLISDTIEPGRKFGVADVSFLTPSDPTKIVCVGLNYKDHAAELDMKIPGEPILFMKPNTSLIAAHEKIFLPDQSERVDYEAELGVVIGKEADNVDESDAERYILGYTCLNDVTARDLQEKDGQWTRAKSFKTFCPVGPYVETAVDPKGLDIRTYLNGGLKQDSNTSNFIFSVQKIVSYISKVMPLMPGDIIATGTPPGVGPMKSGDEVIVEIEGVGRLVNYVE